MLTFTWEGKMVSIIQWWGFFWWGGRMGLQQEEDGGSWKCYETLGYEWEHINEKHGSLVSRIWCSSMLCLVSQLCPTLKTPWTVVLQAPLSLGILRQEYWSGLSCSSPGDLPNPGIEPRSPTLPTDSLLSEPPGKPLVFKYKDNNSGMLRSLSGRKHMMTL